MTHYCIEMDNGRRRGDRGVGLGSADAHETQAVQFPVYRLFVQVDRMPKQYGVNPDFSEPLRSQIFGILNCPPDTDWLR